MNDHRQMLTRMEALRPQYNDTRQWKVFFGQRDSMVMHMGFKPAEKEYTTCRGGGNQRGGVLAEEE